MTTIETHRLFTSRWATLYNADQTIFPMTLA